MSHIYSKTFTIQWIVKNIEQFNLSPPYQRKADAWKHKQRQDLIDSAIRDYPIPPIYLHDNNDVLDVIDGANRIRTFSSYYGDSFALGDKAVFDEDNLSGLRFSDLPEHYKLAFLSKNIEAVIVFTQDTAIIGDMFQRLGSGTPLNTPEKLHAQSGFVRDLVVNAGSHPAFTKTKYKNYRYKYEYMAAQCLILILNDGFSKIKTRDIKETYEIGKTKDRFLENYGKEKLLQYEWTLNFTNEAFEEKHPLFTATFLHIWVTLLCVLYDIYNLEGKERQIGDWYMSVMSQAAYQMELPLEERDAPLSYIYNASHNYPAAQKLKIDYLKKMLFNDFNLKPIFNQNGRYFTEKQRVLIYHRANQQCESKTHKGVRDVAWGEWHAHHIVPHSQGGKTELSNAQCLCIECHKKVHNSAA